MRAEGEKGASRTERGSWNRGNTVGVGGLLSSSHLVVAGDNHLVAAGDDIRHG